MALGQEYGGLFTQQPNLQESLMDSSKNSGEQLWPMPVTKTHLEGMKGTVSDLNNDTSIRWAGASYAAGFLQHFIDEGVHFAHLDIGGVALSEGKQLKGATGFGVGLLVDFVKKYAEKK